MEKIKWQEVERHYGDGTRKACQIGGIGIILKKHGSDESGLAELGTLFTDLCADLLMSFDGLKNILENVANGEAEVLKEVPKEV